MAGEWSKKIGEDGERIALKLMRIIGWENIQKGLDIPCMRKEAHQREKAHGLDGLFTYSSPLQDRQLRHACVSIKYHDKGYPEGLPSLFKDHVKKLDQTIECFEDSEARLNAAIGWESYVDREDIVGVLIWLHGDRENDSHDDLIDQFEDTRIPSDVELKRPILLIDQNRANFIFETFNYVSRNYQNYDFSFNYHRTGQNNIDDEIQNNGPILPWELLTSGLLVYRAVKERSHDNEKVLLFFSIDDFDADGCRRIMSLAQHMSNNLGNKIEICFPNYVAIRHENAVNAIKSSFQDHNFTKIIEFNSYKHDIRN